MAIASFRPKSSETIRAVQLCKETASEARSWCRGSIVDTEDGQALKVPTIEGVILMHYDSYLCESRRRGFFVMTAEEFDNAYEQVRRSTTK